MEPWLEGLIKYSCTNGKGSPVSASTTTPATEVIFSCALAEANTTRSKNSMYNLNLCNAVAAYHNQYNTYPLQITHLLMKDQHSGEHSEYKSKARERVDL